MKILTKEELEKLSTQRLLQILKITRRQTHSYYENDEKEVQNYFDLIKSILDTREHLSRKRNGRNINV